MLVELKDLYRTPTFVIQFSVGQFEFLRKPCFRFVFVIRIRIKVLNKYLKILKSGKWPINYQFDFFLHQNKIRVNKTTIY